MQYKVKQFYLFLAFLLVVSACDNNKFDIELKEKIQLETHRFDRELMQKNKTTEEVSKALKEKYPYFLDRYSIGVLKLGSAYDAQFPKHLSMFRENPLTIRVHDEIEKTITDVEPITKAVNQAVSYYHHYFPNYLLPQFYYIQTGFNQRVIVDSLILGVGLDMALGSENPYYDSLAIPKYMSKQLNTDGLAIDAIRGIAWSEFAFSGENLASNMIYEGKIQYIIDACFPKTAAHKKFNYSEAQWDWLIKHESKIWNTIIEQELLYMTNFLKIKNMIDSAPFTNLFGKNSPPKIGVWVGWRIVHAYMKAHPQTTLQELMQINNIELLNNSKYKP